MKRTLSAALSLLLAVSASAQAPAASLLTKIGTAAAVRGSVKAVSSGNAVGHVISSGKPLFLNDHVTTDAAGRLQVLLVDETIFTLGPNSDMVLDDFVYDPKTSAGKMTASISKGTFRFVTGKIAQKDPSSLKIKVAVGTIGVRGSIGVGETGPGGTTIINGGARVPDNHDDAAGIYAQSNGKTVNMIQPGVGTHIGPDGRMDKAHFMAGELDRIMGTLQNQVTKNAGNRGATILGRRTVTAASGRETAAGGMLAADAGEALDLSAGAQNTVTQAEQEAARTFSSAASVIPDGNSNWNQIISGVPSGTGSYSATGSDNCTGGLCGAGNAGTFSFSTAVNFATKDITSATFARVTGLGQFNATLTGPVAFGSGSGTATFSYNTMSVSGTGTYTGTTGTFVDRAGTIAKDLTVNLNVTDISGGTTTGTLTGLNGR